MISPESQGEKYSKIGVQNANKKKTRATKMGKFLEFKDIDKAMEAAAYYGFSPVHPPEIKKADLEKADELIEQDSSSRERASFPTETALEEKNSLLRHYVEHNLIAEPQPIMFSYKNYDNFCFLIKILLYYKV